MEQTITQNKKWGFTINLAHGDNEFQPLDEWFTNKQIALVTCVIDTHVPSIERTKKFLKE